MYKTLENHTPGKELHAKTIRNRKHALGNRTEAREAEARGVVRVRNEMCESCGARQQAHHIYCY